MGHISLNRITKAFGTTEVIPPLDLESRPGAMDGAAYLESLRDGREVWEVHTHGGRKGTGLEAVSWAQQVEQLGAGEIVLTSMDADGTQDGYDLEITAAVSRAVTIPVVASGGAGRPEHLADAIQRGHADAALAASIFHFGTYTIAETKRIMAARGIPVRQPSPLAA